MRELLEKELNDAGLSRTEIRRIKDNIEVIVWVAKPGVVLGQDGKHVEEIVKKLTKLCNGAKVKISVQEVKNVDLDATLVARSIALQLEQRASFRTAQRKRYKELCGRGLRELERLFLVV